MRKQLFILLAAVAMSLMALAISQGDPSVFFTHPISAGILGLSFLLLILPLLYRLLRRS